MDILLDLGIDEQGLWQAIEQRDRSYDGKLVMGVRSTGIYCKPSCPSRQPRRAQVRFFYTPEQAEAAGFRACKRCRPNQPDQLSAQAELAQRARAWIDAQDGAAFTLEQLGQALAVSPYHLQRTFKATLGVSPHQYAAQRRLERFKTEVRNGADVTGALYEAGYGSNSRLYEQAAARLGMTPAAYRKRGQGMLIRYTLIQTPLGCLLAAATERGLSAVSFGVDEAALVADLEHEYPAAEIVQDAAFMQPYTQALGAYLSGAGASHLELPLDLQATAFQLRVWEALRRIPYGETRSYSQVAAQIGKPKAVRAVANACASNPVPLVTPCHRVTRHDGSLGGYRYGTHLKQTLLDLEQETKV